MLRRVGGRVFSRGMAAGLSSVSSLPSFETIAVEEVGGGVVEVRLHRPDKSNAMNRAMWREFREVFGALEESDGDVRCVVVTGSGGNFTGGIDLGDHASLLGGGGGDDAADVSRRALDVSRRALALRRMIRAYQGSFDAVEGCEVPVIAAIHGACIGAGVDLASACDIRLCSKDAVFSVREAAIGLAADVGTLQRLPRIVGSESLVRELAFTARSMAASEALSCGLVSRVLEDKKSLRNAAFAMAARIASLSPVAIRGTKENLNVSRDLPVKDGLRYMQAWNAAHLQSSDLPEAAAAAITGQTPEFPPIPPKL